MFILLGSLSARRAWIEMPVPRPPQIKMMGSLSARRAWIEMTLKPAEFVAT